jgi:hypothetical protein
MTELPSLQRFAVVVAITMATAAPLAAQGQGRGGGPRYDPATEATVTGTVDAVEQVTATGAGRRALGGTHLTLKTGTETLQVHLGPAAFLEEKKLAVAAGDTLTITGSRVKVGDEAVFIARDVKKGDTTWTLRDAAGLPLWGAYGKRK